MNKIPHILFIDDGIGTTYFSFIMHYNYEITNENYEIKKIEYHNEEISHGTICAAIVKKYCPQFTCSSLKILGGINKKCNIDILCKAIEWCLDKEFDIINMSLGTVDIRDSKKLIKLINKLSHTTTLVGAISNKKLITYPASFSNVIGVICTPQNEKKDIIYCNNSIYGANFFAKATHMLQTKQGAILTTDNANSFAAPYITSLIAKYKLYRKHQRKIISELSNKSCINYIFPDYLDKTIIISSLNLKENFKYIPFNYIKVVFSNNFCNIKEKIWEYEHGKSIALVFDDKIQEQTANQLINECIHSKKDLSIVNMKKKGFKPNSEFINKNYTIYSYLTKLNYEKNILNHHEIPTIKIETNDLKYTIGICCTLYKTFLYENYLPCVTMDNPISHLLGFYYINFNKNNAIKLLCELQRTNQSDVTICGLAEHYNNNDQKRFNRNLKPDIIVRINKNCDCEIVYTESTSSRKTREKQVFVGKYDPLQNSYISERILRMLEGK